MKSNYQHIFTPLTVKNMTIKNRIVMMPMGICNFNNNINTGNRTAK